MEYYLDFVYIDNLKNFRYRMDKFCRYFIQYFQYSHQQCRKTYPYDNYTHSSLEVFKTSEHYKNFMYTKRIYI